MQISNYSLQTRSSAAARSVLSTSAARASRMAGTARLAAADRSLRLRRRTGEKREPSRRVCCCNFLTARTRFAGKMATQPTSRACSAFRPLSTGKFNRNGRRRRLPARHLQLRHRDNRLLQKFGDHFNFIFGFGNLDDIIIIMIN